MLPGKYYAPAWGMGMMIRMKSEFGTVFPTIPSIHYSLNNSGAMYLSL